MLRKRIEKLEKLRPLGTGDLLNRWERQAIALLTSEEQALVQASFAKGARSNNLDTDARAAAMQRYEEALANAIREVSDSELDRMILMLAPQTSTTEAIA